jgi:hypothetical protein
MIGQKIGLPYLVPLAINALEQDPLAQGDYYPGDLLANVIDACEWLQANQVWLPRVIRVTERGLAELEEDDTELQQRLGSFLARARN